MQKFFLYARKSTDVEDKQVLSIEAQITELRAYARNEGLNIIEELIEKQSAKIPGRPIFNAMIERIEHGEANGIISWHPDRLARNSVDGGKIIYLLDCGHIVALKFPQFWFESTPQGKFMLNIAFGQSKYYVDSLSENVKRGMRQKVRRGEYPGLAPFGYFNDPCTKNVAVDKKKAEILRKTFELYAKGNSRLEDISNFLAQQGITSRNGKNWKRDRISFILSNPFYVGFFRYSKELYEGKHQPVISKKIFDQVQNILKQKGRPHHKTKNEPQAFCGMLKCGTCGMGITGEYRVKKQKNGNTHDYIYYHCTKKNKAIKCDEPCIRQESLDEQTSLLLQKFSLSKDWATQLTTMVEKDKNKDAQTSVAFVQNIRNTIEALKTKLQRLLDSYLEQDIERETYLEKKAKFMSEKKSLEEKIIHLEQKQTGWIEPMKEWIKEAVNLPKIARENNLFAKKVVAKEIFGSNLRLTGGQVVWGEIKNGDSWPQKPWAVLYATREKIMEIEEYLIVVPPRGIEPRFNG